MKSSLFGPTENTKANLLIRYANLNKYLGEASDKVMTSKITHPSTGWGVKSKMSGKGFEQPNIGISQAIKWADFGKYKIDMHKLESGIMALRTSTGSIVGKYPTQKLPSKIVDVVNTIVTGHQPSFEHLSKLNSEEISFIKKLMKNVGVFQQVGMGLPSNPDDDEDIQEFEIMKGELLAGNDNKTLVQNFKKQIFKLMTRDLLPKSEGKELLMELAMMGH